MKHFLKKNSLTIKGSGGGGGSPPTPPPPVVTQYPAVLAPPQVGQLNSITSFSYAEMIDLLSDGPIEGLVNKDGQKVYDENIFEGIYLNDTAVKETSLTQTQQIDVSFLKDALKKHFLTNVTLTKGTKSTTSLLPSDYQNNTNFNYYNPGAQITATTKNPSITIDSYHPSDSISAFLISRNIDVASKSLIQKAFDLSPIVTERPFLTRINIPKFKIKIYQNLFDKTEGGDDGNSPLKIKISNLANYIYFNITNDNLTSFNYFELPRSFAENSTKYPSGKSSFNKTLLLDSEVDSNGASLFTYEVYGLNLYIWSIYSFEIGIKNIDIILDTYFSSLTIYQNNYSLYNFNLIQSEFKNGSEIQTPLNYFSDTEIDSVCQQELIGPYKVTNNFRPTSSYSNGGIQRLISLCASSSSCPPVNVSIENETSDDVRYIKSWPVEYNCNGYPYIICNSTVNYSQFDKTSTLRSEQEAVPITHLIGNQNVESVYVTVNVSSLYDVAAIDMVADNSANGIVDNKVNTAEDLPQGVGTYCQLPGTLNYFKNIVCNLYFLIYGNSIFDGKIIDASNTVSGSAANFYNLLDTNDPKKYYNQMCYSVWANDNVYKPNYDINQFTASTYTATNGWTFSFPSNSTIYSSCLFNYNVYNGQNCYSTSFDAKSISNLNCASLLEKKLKTLTEDGAPYYCYNLNSSQTINATNYFIDHTDQLTDKQKALFKTVATNLNESKNFYVASIEYYSPASSQFLTRRVVSLDLLPYINFCKIYCTSQGSYVSDRGVYATLVDTTKYVNTFDKNKYPNIDKYLTQYMNSSVFKGNISQYL